jgi:hypothetical protein
MLTSCDANLPASMLLLGADDETIAQNGKLTSWNTVPLLKLIVAQLIKKLRVFYGTRKSIKMVKCIVTCQ